MTKRKRYDHEFKRRIVEEYLAGHVSAQEIAEREGISTGMIYQWKTFLAEKAKQERIEGLQKEEGYSLDQAKKIQQMEIEMEAYQKKVAQLTLENDLLKKIHPAFQGESESNGYAETKKKLDRYKGRVK